MSRTSFVSDPLSFVAFALAAGNGRVDDFPVRRLVSAGFRLLRGSAPLVRALAGRRAGVLLHSSPQFLTALAAADGRGAVLLDQDMGPEELALAVKQLGVGAVLTTAALASRLPAGLPQVLLDESPQRARVVLASGEAVVDLTGYDALGLEGDADAPGADEEAVVMQVVASPGHASVTPFSHRFLLARARAVIEEIGFSPSDHTLALSRYSEPFALMMSALAPLVAGGRVSTMSAALPAQVAARLEGSDVSVLVGTPEAFTAIAEHLEGRGAPLQSGSLRTCLCGGAPVPAGLEARWAAQAAIRLRAGRA